MSKEAPSAVRLAFIAYREAVVAEAAAREAHYFPAAGSKVETDQALIAAIGKLGETRAALDCAILDAHGVGHGRPA